MGSRAGSEAVHRRAIAAAALVFAVAAGVDVATGPALSLVGVLVLGPLLAAAMGATSRDVLWLTFAAILVGLPVGASNHIFFEPRHFIGLGLVTAGGLLAAALARTIADVRALREREREAHERLSLLDRSSSLIGAPLDAIARLEELTMLPVPELGTLCIVDLVREDGTFGRQVISADHSERADAVRRLRDRYPVDPLGGHPAAVAARTGTPQVKSVLVGETLTGYAIDDEHRALLDAVGHTSVVSVPLIARGRTLGVLSVLRFADAPPFGEREVALVSDLAARSALSVDNARLFDELQATEARLEAILSVMAEAVTVQDRQGKLVYLNDAAVGLLGFATRDEALGAHPAGLIDHYEILDEHGEPFDMDRLPGRAALLGNVPEPTMLRRIDTRTGEERWLLVKASAVADEATGEPVLAVNVIEDLTEERRAAQTSAILAAVSQTLASSLDFEDALARMALALAPRVADRCTVALLGDDEELRIVATAPPFAADALEAEALRAAAAGVAVLRPDGTALAVPLLAGERAVGVIAFHTGDGRRRLTEADLALAGELGRRAGVAVSNARVHSARHHVAVTLQRSLLPPRLPDVPGLAIAARFRAAGEANQVGGDFYDVFEAGGSWIVAIGDVTGKGPDAAAITALARYTMRTAASYERHPARILNRLNEALMREGERRRLCTAICLRIDVDRERPQLTIASAGHPPPVRLGPGLALEEIVAPGPLLGAFEGARWEAVTIGLGPGEALVLYTDGVTDTLGADERFGVGRLHATLRAAAGAGADAIAAAVDAALIGFEEGQQRDDVALLVLRAAESGARETPDLASSSRAPA